MRVIRASIWIVLLALSAQVDPRDIKVPTDVDICTLRPELPQCR